jgi:Transcriptional regulators
VAISTVSKVFSGRGEVMPALRMRVLTAASELGYQPNSIAQSLRRGATALIGFVASDLSDPFSAEIVAGAEFVLRPAGYALLVMSSNHDPSTDAANVRHLNSRRVDSILVSPPGKTIASCWRRWRSSTGPSSRWRASCAPTFPSTASAPITAAGWARRSGISSGSAIAGSPR